ncbi:MAG: phasin family protein [Methyloceanibacter sp.]
MTKSASKATAGKARGTHRKTAAKLTAGKASGTHRKTAPKTAAERVRGTHRKTAAKLTAGKASGTLRKTAPKTAAERVRGTTRKTAAQLEEFARVAQMPGSMRAPAEQRVAQTRELYEHSLGAVLESWERIVVAAGQGTVALNRKAIDIARRNINSGFGLAERLAGAKSLAEIMEMQAAYWRKQLGELATQSEEMRTLSTKVTADVTAPIKVQVTRGMEGFHKAT